jgi:hypothetical protein
MHVTKHTKSIIRRVFFKESVNESGITDLFHHANHPQMHLNGALIMNGLDYTTIGKMQSSSRARRAILLFKKIALQILKIVMETKTTQTTTTLQSLSIFEFLSHFFIVTLSIC